MNTGFFLSIERELIRIGRPNSERQYYMAIYSAVSSPSVRVFTSYKNPSKEDMIEVGKAYAKRLNIVFKEPS